MTSARKRLPNPILFVPMPVVLLIALFGLQPAWAATNNPVHGMHQEILSEMEVEEPPLLPAVERLWRSAIERDPTLQLALQKMAEKSGNLKPKDKSAWTARMIQSAAQIGGMGGAVMLGNPAPLLGSSVISRFVAPDTAPKQLTQVTSADLVILAREIDAAQSQLIVNYIRYRHAQSDVATIQHALDDLQNQSKVLPQDSPVLVDMIRTLILNRSFELQQARDTVQTYRNLLVLSAGEDAMAEVDKMVDNEINEKTHD